MGKSALELDDGRVDYPLTLLMVGERRGVQSVMNGHYLVRKGEA